MTGALCAAVLSIAGSEPPGPADEGGIPEIVVGSSAPDDRADVRRNAGPARDRLAGRRGTRRGRAAERRRDSSRAVTRGNGGREGGVVGDDEPDLLGPGAPRDDAPSGDDDDRAPPRPGARTDDDDLAPAPCACPSPAADDDDAEAGEARALVSGTGGGDDGDEDPAPTSPAAPAPGDGDDNAPGDD